MTRMVTPPLAPFVDALPVPRRLLAPEHGGRLTVSIRAGAHRFHCDLPESRIWGFEGTVPGPTIEAERAQTVTVEWRNELDDPLPVVVTIAPEATDAEGVPVQCAPGLSGGTPDEAASAWAAAVRARRSAGGCRVDARASRSKAARWRLRAVRRAACVRVLCASGPRECSVAPAVAWARGRLSTCSTAWFCQNAKPNATARAAALTINRIRSSSTCARSGRRASWLIGLEITCSSLTRRLLFVRSRDLFGKWRPRIVTDRVLELPESLAERSARVG
jgi:Multicopper oxidase